MFLPYDRKGSASTLLTLLSHTPLLLQWPSDDFVLIKYTRPRIRPHPMSSASVSLPAASFPESSRSDLERRQESSQPYPEHVRSWQLLAKGGIFGSCFASGLPTPPETRAMTGTSINQHHPNDIVSQHHYPSKFSDSAYASKDAEVRRYPHTVENYSYDTSSTSDQPPFWSASREKEVHQPSRNIPSSDSAIASYLQIPASINDSKGSLAEFAAEVGYDFFVSLKPV
jgi:hypothetical protein